MCLVRANKVVNADVFSSFHIAKVCMALLCDVIAYFLLKKGEVGLAPGPQNPPSRVPDHRRSGGLARD